MFDDTPAGADARPVAAETSGTAPTSPTAAEVLDRDLVEADLIVEDVSIDGMCGVY